MLPTINGKSLLECAWDDIQVIIDNEDFRESESLDYKKTLGFLAIPPGNRELLNKEKAEFRKDVCSMANAQGGYIIYGIKEDGKGVPHELQGMSIKDTNKDVFESQVKNVLQAIQPKPPHYEFRYIAMPDSDLLIIVLYVYRDLFVPYLFIENNNDYRIHKRVGQSNSSVSYAELKNMFVQSLSIEKEVQRFRQERIDHYDSPLSTPKNKYLMLHIIPDTFMDSSYNEPMFIFEQRGADFSSIYDRFECATRSMPMIEGLWYRGRGIDAECRLYNNGVSECYYPLYNKLLISDYFPKGFINWENYIFDILSTINQYTKRVSRYIHTSRIYVCISIIGCSGVTTERSQMYSITGEESVIDRKHLCINPIVIENMGEFCLDCTDAQRIKYEFMIALGIKYNKKLKDLIKELYGE